MFSCAPPRPLEVADVALCITGLREIALAPALGLLGRAELERAQRITCKDYRLQVVKARALLRVMLSRCTGESAKSFEFDEGGGTRPRLRTNPWGLHFSVSHSDDRVAVALSTAPVGIDIERVGADCSWQAIAAICFHSSERGLLQGAGGGAAREAFFEIWTRKEAYLKAIGTGLDTDPASFSIAAPDSVVATDASGPRVDAWFTRSIDAPAGYKAALASRCPRPRLIHWRLDGALAGHASSRAIDLPRRQTLPGAVAASAQRCAG